jgi:hypothetical protein
MRGGHRRKPTKNRELSKFRNYDAASGTIFRITELGSVFKKAKRDFIYIFSLEQGRQKI